LIFFIRRCGEEVKMGWEKNYKNRDRLKNRNQNERKKAYQPKLPFKTVEGVGALPWQKLDMGAIGVFMKFYFKFNGFNRYDLSLTYREVKHKMSSLVFTRYIWQLIGYGFLDIRRTGRLERNCSLYGISDRWREFSEDPKKLDEIEKLLNQIELLKRQPGSPKKRMKIWGLRKNILKLGGHPKIRHPDTW